MPSPADANQTGQLLALIATDPWRMACLQAVAGLGLPDCWIGAGFLRTPMWDRLQGFSEATPLNDIDVIYFDPESLDPEADYALEADLARLMPGAPWSVRNQARMHRRNGDRPYRSSEDALRHWLETPTAVAIRWNAGCNAGCNAEGNPRDNPRGNVGENLELLAPFGLDDLMTLMVRPTPHARAKRMADYHARIADKDWQAIWPDVRILSA